MAAWILDSLDLSRKTNPLSPPFLLYCTAKKESSSQPKTSGHFCEGYFYSFLFCLPPSAKCCFVSNLKRINGLQRSFNKPTLTELCVVVGLYHLNITLVFKVKYCLFFVGYEQFG